MYPFAVVGAAAAAAATGYIAAVTEEPARAGSSRGEAEAAAKLAPGVPFFKVDGTEADALATHLDIKGYPTLLFVRRGVPMFEVARHHTRDLALAGVRGGIAALNEANPALEEESAR